MLSGQMAGIYSVALTPSDQEGVGNTLYEAFINENIENFRDEVIDINERLWTIGHRTGARDHFFKDFEGALGDGVCALYDLPEKQLRLYCIRFGKGILVIGGGGPKPENIRALQEDPKLTNENSMMRQVSKAISERIRERTIVISENEIELTGDFYFEDDER
jgi:hypothetical protein